MTQHADILDAPEPVRKFFFGAVAIHAAVIGGMALNAWLATHGEAFGAKDAGGGAVGIEAVNTIPLQHQGQQNPLANDTESQTPQQPAKAIDRTKAEKPPPDAIAIKSRQLKKKPAEVASEKQRFRPFDQLEPNQLYTKQAPAVSNPLYAPAPGAGRIGTGAQTTLGTRFAGYGKQIQELVAQKWRTGDVDARIQTAPIVVATFDLMRDGSIRNVQLLQSSGIPPLDYSVQRAIHEAAPFPPLPAGFDRDSARVEFDFELKR